MCSRSMPQDPFFGAAHRGLEACCSMPQHAAASNFLSSCVWLPVPALFARETFCLPHVSPVCFHLSCHESVICTNNIQSTVNTKHTIAVFFVRRPRSACHVERTFSLMGHIQTKDRLHMGNNTLRHLAMMYVNKPTTDDPDDESDEFGPTVLCMLSLVCEFNFPQMRRYPHVQVEACRSMLQHKKFFQGTAHAC